MNIKVFSRWKNGRFLIQSSWSLLALLKTIFQEKLSKINDYQSNALLEERSSKGFAYDTNLTHFTVLYHRKGSFESSTGQPSSLY